MLSGLSISSMVGILNIDSSPNRGIAAISDKTMKTMKLAITTNIENINCERGFISRNAVKIIGFEFLTKITEDRLNEIFSD